ncbi:hypothetical protein FRB95_006422 [Tulasnella sp. JGI-2019a]|nr:hypothetical protein FRB95_006422 [Tulasnella sp. JGI-2019a]
MHGSDKSSKTETALSDGPSESGATNEAPPSYGDATGRRGMPTPVPCREVEASRPRVNNIYIKEKNSGVKGEWIIDPDITVPLSLLPEVEEGEERVNLRLHSNNGSVAGKVRLIGDQPTKSYLHASAHNGSVQMKILSRQNQKFNLKAHSHNGNVTVSIPIDFEGPVTCTTKNGSVKFSQAIQQRLTQLGRSDKTRKAFIGSLPTSEQNTTDAKDKNDLEAWSGDELILSSANGNLRIDYTQEGSDETGSGGLKDFLRRFMGGSSPAPSDLTSSSASSSGAGSGYPVDKKI